MKKLILPFLVCFFLTGCCIPASHTPSTGTWVTTAPAQTLEAFTEPSTEPETAPTLPPHSAYYIEGLDVEDVIVYFNEICLDAEYVLSGNASLVQKWKEPIYCYIEGTMTDEDRQVLERFTQQLNSIEGFPGFYITQDLDQVNLRMYFCDQDKLLSIMGSNFSGDDGAVTFWYDGNNAIYNENICIRTDLTQHVRNSVLQEEIYNGLGPVQDTDLRTDSICYSGYTDPQEPTEVDMLILQLLYHPDIECGMDADECARVIRTLYY